MTREDKDMITLSVFFCNGEVERVIEVPPVLYNTYSNKQIRVYLEEMTGDKVLYWVKR